MRVGQLDQRPQGGKAAVDRRDLQATLAHLQLVEGDQQLGEAFGAAEQPLGGIGAGIEVPRIAPEVLEIGAVGGEGCWSASGEKGIDETGAVREVG